MKLDFHTHGKLAKRLPFSTTYTDWLFGEAKDAGLSALCLTEHFNTLQFDELYAYLAGEKPPGGGRPGAAKRLAGLSRHGDGYR